MNRWDIINKLITVFKAEKYLEIGIRKGHCFNQVKCKTKIGVDPEPLFETNKPGEVIYAMPSDRYFAKAPEAPFDIVFIDGLHEASQVERDIRNALKYLNHSGAIVCHDMNPRSYQAQFVPRQTKQWNGDCWKAWVQLRTDKITRGAEMFVVDTDEGCGVIIPHSPNPTGQISFNRSPVYEEMANQKERFLNLISIDEFNKRIASYE